MTPPAAHIATLALSHFRSHKRVQLALDGRPVALWGANGAGKTNILEAVSLLSPGRGLRRAAAEEIARKPEAIGWKIAAELSGPQPHEIEMSFEPGSGTRQLRIDDKTAPQLRLSQLCRIVWLVPAQDRLWIEGAEGRRRFLDRVTMSFFPEHGPATLSYEKAMRERNRLIKEGHLDPTWFTALEGQLAEAAAAITAHRHAAINALRAAQANASSAFPAADLSLSEAAEISGGTDTFATAFAENRPRDIAAGRALIGPHRTDLIGRYAAKDMAADQCSTGEQKALLISLILANAAALKAQIGTAPLVLLDEVAAHLDADRRAALFNEICALGGQAWMTGTGPELFTELGPRAQGFALEVQGEQTEIVPQ